jgi:hypothetical protein
MKCEKDKKEFNDKQLELHHYFPRQFGGTDLDGRLYLCKKHHKEIHALINALGLKDKEKIIDFTKRWLESKENSKHLCPDCKDEKADMAFFMIKADRLILNCRYCGKKIEDKEDFNSYLNKEIQETIKGEEGNGNKIY